MNNSLQLRMFIRDMKREVRFRVCACSVASDAIGMTSLAAISSTTINWRFDLSSRSQSKQMRFDSGSKSLDLFS